MAIISGKYKIKEITFIQISPVHIPYYAYMIVSGPRGGEYIVDVFNTELILKTYFKVPIMPNTTDVMMRRIGNELGIIKYVPAVDNLESYITKYSPNHLVRRQGIVMAKTIGNKLEFPFEYKQLS